METFIEKALSKADSELLEIRIQEIVTTEVIYLGQELDKIGTKKLKGGSVRAFKKGGFGFATFTKLEDLLQATDTALKLTRLFSDKNLPTKLVPIPPVKDKIEIKIKDDPRKTSLEKKESLARSYNQLILKGGQAIISSQVIYRDAFLKQIFASSEGTFLEEERIYTGIACTAIAKDGANVQTSFISLGDQRGFSTLLNREKEVEGVVKDALDMLKAEKVKGGIYTVILDPRLAGVFIHEAFGHLSEADHVVKNDKLTKIMKMGSHFGPDELSVVDDATLPLERGSYKYDDEGIPARKVYLIKDGYLNSRLHSKLTATYMNEELTGNARAIDYLAQPIVRMSNTYIEPRNKSLDELIEDIKDGLYVVDTLGGQTELEMFTFSAQKAYKIQNGRLGPLVRDVVISGNLFQTLKNITGIGNDLVITGGLGGCGKRGQFPLPVSDGAPHIRIKDVVVGGV